MISRASTDNYGKPQVGKQNFVIQYSNEFGCLYMVVMFPFQSLALANYKVRTYYIPNSESQLNSSLLLLVKVPWVCFFWNALWHSKDGLHPGAKLACTLLYILLYISDCLWGSGENNPNSNEYHLRLHHTLVITKLNSDLCLRHAMRLGFYT